MLQLLQQKVEVEGAKEEELHEKFLCYCNNGAGGLEESIEGYKQRIPTLEAAIEAATSKTTMVSVFLRDCVLSLQPYITLPPHL